MQHANRARAVRPGVFVVALVMSMLVGVAAPATAAPPGPAAGPTAASAAPVGPAAGSPVPDTVPPADRDRLLPAGWRGSADSARK